MCEGIGVLRRSWEGVMNEGAGQSEWSCNFDENEKRRMFTVMHCLYRVKFKLLQKWVEDNGSQKERKSRDICTQAVFCKSIHVELEMESKENTHKNASVFSDSSTALPLWATVFFKKPSQIYSLLWLVSSNTPERAQRDSGQGLSSVLSCFHLSVSFTSNVNILWDAAT